MIKLKINLNNKLLLIVLFALLIRLVTLIAAHPWSDPVLLDDDQSYALMGEYILDNGNFNYNVGSEIYSTLRTPGYPLFIAIIYFMFGKSLWLIPLFQIILDIVTVLLIYFIALEVFDSVRIALTAALLYSISISSIMFTQDIMTETFFVYIFTFFTLFIIWAIRKKNLPNYIIAGIALGISAYVRPVVIYLPILILLIILFTKNSPQRKLILFLTFLFTFLLTIFPWQLRNLDAYGHYKMTSISGYSLYNFNVAIVEADLENKSVEEIVREHLTAVKNINNPFDKSAALEKMAIVFITDHPFEYVKYHFIGILRMFLGTSKAFIMKLFGIKNTYLNDNVRKSTIDKISRNIYSPHEYFLTPILSVINIILYLFALFGIYRIWKTKYKNILLVVLLVLIIVYFANVTSVIGSVRYKQPIIPFYLIFSSVGIIEFFKNIKN